MKIGIVGLQYSGKSTLFATLMAHVSEETLQKHKQEAERGVIKVPDPRLDQLTTMYNPRKKVNATIEYLKVPGLDQEGHRGSGLPAQFLANVKTVDVILLLVRAFENALYPHPSETIDPVRDIRFILSEFLLSDLGIIENRMEKLEKLIMKTQSEQDKRELAVLQKCREVLEAEKPISELGLGEQEFQLIRNYQFLTIKPVLFVLNVGEDDIRNIPGMVDEIRNAAGEKALITGLSAEIEREISQLAPEDAGVFMEDLGIDEPATDKLIHASYKLLGLYSFFTVGDDECRAWTVRAGTNAQKAAGVIHSDMEKGFIRAEVVSYEDLIREGSMAACRDKGLWRLEGKDYIVQDGDILSIRFNL
jgi:hypothetical protein